MPVPQVFLRHNEVRAGAVNVSARKPTFPSQEISQLLSRSFQDQPQVTLPNNNVTEHIACIVWHSAVFVGNAGIFTAIILHELHKMVLCAYKTW